MTKTDETAPEPEARPFGRFRRKTLLPEAGAGGAPLTAVIAVMSFLAVLALASALIINRSASAWTASLRSEMTIQVKGASAAEIAAGASAAMRVLDETEGVAAARLRTQEEAEALLEPWLGRGNAGAFLTVPALIEIQAEPALLVDPEPLRARLAEAAPGASLNDHGAWHDRLDAAARSGQAVAVIVLLLILGAACAISVFAARAGLAANDEIVSILHLVGATDEFIAAEVQRRFFVLGLRGATIGLALAILVLVAAALAVRAGVGADEFLPRFSLNWTLALWLLLVPIATCFVTAATARLTVLMSLKSQY